MKKISLLLVLILISSCSSVYYDNAYDTQPVGLDFSTGKWLLGNIEVDASVKDDLTNKVLNDFSKHLNNRIKYSLTEKGIMVARSIPLNPSKTEILRLKAGTGYDYYINIKGYNKKDLAEFNPIENYFYDTAITYGIMTMEVYNLNSGEIVYRQFSKGTLHENTSLNSNPSYTVIMGCYKKIMKEIETKY